MFQALLSGIRLQALAHLSPKRVSYNRFVELEKEALFPLTIFIKTVLLHIKNGLLKILHCQDPIRS